MLTRRRHKVQVLRIRRAHRDEYQPAVVIGPVFLRFPHRDDYWRQEDQMPRRQINGRWLPGIRASHIQWVSRVGHKGSCRGDRRLTMQQKAAERCQLYRYTSQPF